MFSIVFTNGMSYEYCDDTIIANTHNSNFADVAKSLKSKFDIYFDAEREISLSIETWNHHQHAYIPNKLKRESFERDVKLTAEETVIYNLLPLHLVFDTYYGYSQSWHIKLIEMRVIPVI